MKPMKFFCYFLTLLFVSCLLTKNELVEYLQPYWDDLNAGIYKPQGFSYSQSFERKLESEEWKKTIDSIKQQYGSIKSMKSTSLSKVRLIAGEASGTSYYVNYRIERELGTTYEEIELFQSKRSEGKLEIIDHSIMIINLPSRLKKFYDLLDTLKPQSD